MKTSELWWDRVVLLWQRALKNTGDCREMYCRGLQIARMEYEVWSAIETVKERAKK